MPPLKCQYPHVDQVKDPAIQQSLRLLWDLIYQRGDAISELQVLTGVHETTLGSVTSNLTVMQKQILAAQAAAGKETTPVGQAVEQTSSGGQGDGSGGGGSQEPNPQGAADTSSGCAQNPGSGHVATGTAKTFTTVGMIICGTGVEFSSLLAVTIDLPTRQANALQLLQRMIWHLQQAGFSAGRQQNPSGAMSNDKLTVQVDGAYYAFDLFSAYDDFTVPMRVQTIMVAPAKYIVDGGIPD